MEDVLQVWQVQAHQDTWGTSLNRLLLEVETFQVVTAQSVVVQLQTEVVQEYSCWNNGLEERVGQLEDEVKRIREAPERTLGNSIIIKDDNDVKEEEPRIVYDLVLIDD